MSTKYIPHTRGTNMETEEIKLSDEGTSSEEDFSAKTVMEAEVAEHDSDASMGTQKTTETITAVLDNLELQKKKLSGAQLRKLRKERKMAAGTWTTEKPPKKDHRHSKTTKENPGERKEDVKRGQEGKKRPREDSKTPPQRNKKPRKTQTGTYSEALTEFKMAVIDRRHPEVTLDQEQAELIQNKLVDAMDGTPTGSDCLLQFARTTFSGGVLWMTCANENTKRWLMENVKNLGGLWEGADLTTVESKDLPKRPRVLVFIPKPVEEEEKIRTRLGKQNAGLRVGGWLLLSRKMEDAGTILAYSIDEASFGALERNRFRAYYRLGTVSFRVLKGLDGGRTQDPAGQPATQ